ncbi:MAG: hypothetical protein EOP84_31645, partial [Verrucomicrobiaceae bacterium]
FTNPVNNWYQSNNGSLSMAPGAAKSVLMDFTVPTNIPINTGLVYKDSAVYTAPMTNWLTDYTPWNNVKYTNASVVSSYDPNFKEVSPKGAGANGMITSSDSVLEYMVHFQNLGNYQAQKVVVLDTLDADLDWTTLRPIYKSHPCVVTMKDNGVVAFTFNNIILPAKMFNELGSNGMFTYTIKTKLQNPTSRTTDVEVVFEASAGYASGLFVVNGRTVTIDQLSPKTEGQVMRVKLAPGQTQSFDILTLPLSGSAYPATLTIRPVTDALRASR